MKVKRIRIIIVIFRPKYKLDPLKILRNNNFNILGVSPFLSVIFILNNFLPEFDHY